MKIFVAHKVTGENWKELERIIKNVCNSLEKAGHSYYCTFLEEIDKPKKFEGWKRGDFLTYALKELDKSDFLLALIFSNEKSEGMLMEIGYALAKKKKIILAINKRVDSYTRDIADKTVEFESIDSLCKQLEVLK